ncbi:hypothetical protein [Providencia burhodogranariea]|uniref:Lipoprotein n=1 Tax=Providencia burhodogranariea DSM 19968 TaxID=1141662 RepID=K8WME0_9GAMM|nr:hypothetical protein [Providencia burhodogranariea]EKT61773.1 hypothetical protein OOA_10113 [Providencia burhodogranariea DSM 19968]
MQILKGLMLLSLGLLMNGCTAHVWKDSPVVSKDYQYKVQAEDTIVSAFEFKNFKLKLDEKVSNKTLKIPENGVGFVGDTYLYFIAEGADDLLILNKLNKQIILETRNRDKQTIQLKIYESTTPGVTAILSDVLTTRTVPGTQFTDEEKQLLINSGFKLSPDPVRKDWYKVTVIGGVLMAKNSIDYQFDKNEKMTHPYKVELLLPEQVSSFNGLNLISNILATPFTLVGDAVILPIIAVSDVN